PCYLDCCEPMKRSCDCQPRIMLAHIPNADIGRRRQTCQDDIMRKSSILSEAFKMLADVARRPQTLTSPTHDHDPWCDVAPFSQRRIHEARPLRPARP